MCGVRQEEFWDTDAAHSCDTPGTGMFAPEVLDPVVDRFVIELWVPDVHTLPPDNYRLPRDEGEEARFE